MMVAVALVMEVWVTKVGVDLADLGIWALEVEWVDQEASEHWEVDLADLEEEVLVAEVLVVAGKRILFMI